MAALIAIFRAISLAIPLAIAFLAATFAAPTTPVQNSSTVIAKSVHQATSYAVSTRLTVSPSA